MVDPFGIVGVVELSFTLLRDLKKRWKIVSASSTVCEELEQSFGEVQEQLMRLQSSEIPEAIQEEWASVVKQLKSYFNTANKTLKRILDDLESKSKPCALMDANKLNEDLEELKKGFEKHEFKTWFLRTSRMIITLLRQQAMVTTSPDGEFKAAFHVPVIPDRALINLDDPNTMEGNLKRLVLERSSNVIGAVSTKTVSAVAATGLGGVGKTTALKAVGSDQAVQNHYNGGVYFFTLGKNVTESEIIEMLAEAVEHTNGIRTAREMRNKQDVAIAVSKAMNWFCEKRCLFICDDLWRTESKSDGYFYDLKALIPSNSNSCMLFSTRDLNIAKAVDASCQVRFSERSDDVAASMLRTYAGMSVDQCKGESFKLVLDSCGGLPIALAVAGQVVASIASTAEVGAELWNAYEKKLQKARNELLSKEISGNHPGLLAALSASLEGASGLQEFQGLPDELSIQKIHRALCVLKKQAWAPRSTLAGLWGTSEERAEKIAESMGALNLVSIERRILNGELTLGVKLHDLVHDFCLMEASKHKEVAWWHGRLLDGYMFRANSSVGGDGEWWSSDLEDDSYLHAHLTHHLVSSERLKELKKLMLNFQWTCRQLTVNGFLALENDFQLLSFCPCITEPKTKMGEKAANEQGAKVDEEARIKCSIARMWCLGIKRKMFKFWNRDENVDEDVDERRKQAPKKFSLQIGLIIGALRLAWPRVVSMESGFGKSELAFQMVGRLCSFRKDMEAVNKYLNSVEVTAEKPWAMPFGACLEAPRGPGGGKFHMPGEVEAVALIPGTDLVVAGDSDGYLRMFDIKLMKTVQVLEGHKEGVTSVAVSGDGERIVSGSEDGTVRVWDMKTGAVVGEALRGHNGWVTSVAVSGDAGRIVSGSVDSTVCVWDMKTGEVVGEALRGHDKAVMSVTVSGDGERIVSGSDDGTVRVWDMKTGGEVGEPLRGHEGPVRSVAVSGDGERIVSGAIDGTVRVWNMKTGELVGEPLRGHAYGVSSVAVNGDGKRIVSGSYDHTVRVWDMKTGEVVGEPLRGHEASVLSVAVSGDGERIVSGAADDTVRVWDMKTGEVVGAPLRWCDRAVRSVTVSGDGERIVSGSDDGTVRVWDMKTGEVVGEPLRGHEGSVNSVAVSGDGERIVSGSDDGTVRVWDMKTGEEVGEPLRGHEGSVRSVAVSGDGERIVSGSVDGTVRVWDMKTGEEVGEPLRGHEGWVNSVAVSRDGERIVSGSDDGTVRVWDMKTGEEVGEPLRGHEGSVNSVAVSRDGERIVSGSDDGTVRVWDMKTGEEVGEPLRGHEGSVRSVAVSGDDQRILSIYYNSKVCVWDMKSGEVGGPPVLSEYSPSSRMISDVIKDLVAVNAGKDSGVNEYSAAGYLTYCIVRSDGIFYRDWRSAKDVVKMGSFDSAVISWILDADGKLWAALGDGTLAIIRTVE